MVLLWSSVFALVLVGLVYAALVKRQAITLLSSSQISSYAPFTHFASTAYCNPSTTINWSCGCQLPSKPQLPASGVWRRWRWDTILWDITIADLVPSRTHVVPLTGYVGFSPSQNNIVIVAHQGTDTSKLLPILTDIDLVLEPLDSSLFQGVPSYVKTLSVHGASSVIVVGHSLGAALSLLDGLSFRSHLNATVNVRVIGYGMPRVGNKAFADWVDSQLGGQVTHINNRRDPVPILPPRFLGFHHASGEVHITDSGTWESCPRQDNPSSECTVGDVPSIFNGKDSDHYGPYGSISMGC
ncbi:Alpha/Beta hydrolase protein [Lactarius vividus]|nr:Alpha/Beta hydrolase protein [Lactarius vividus]